MRRQTKMIELSKAEGLFTHVPLQSYPQSSCMAAGFHCDQIEVSNFVVNVEGELI